MKCNTLHQKFKNITSIGITLIIVILLILSGPANAVLVEISGLDSDPYAKGGEVDFQISITLHNPDKYVPITNFSLNLTGPTPNVWIFDTTGTVISQNTDNINININKISAQNATHYGGPGEGLGKDVNTGVVYDFPSGFGYGSNYGKGDEGNVTYIYKVTLYTTNLATGNYNVTASLNTGEDIKPSFTSTEAEFSIKAAPVKSSGGGGGGGGGGTSGEAFANIVCTETDRQFVGKDLNVKYNFKLEGNYVQHIEFTGLTSAGKVAAKVEILNHTSTIVEKDAPNIVFKNLNVWVGNIGYFSNNNIKDPTITFIVDRSWVRDNDIILNTVSFYSYNDRTTIWEKMSTQKIGEDSTSYQFKASLPIRGSLGPMAISGKDLVYVPTSAPTPTPVITPTQSVTEQPTSEKTPTVTPVTWTGTWKAKVPGFQLLAALIALITLYFISRRRD